MTKNVVFEVKVRSRPWYVGLFCILSSGKYRETASFVFFDDRDFRFRVIITSLSALSSQPSRQEGHTYVAVVRLSSLQHEGTTMAVVVVQRNRAQPDRSGVSALETTCSRSSKTVGSVNTRSCSRACVRSDIVRRSLAAERMPQEFETTKTTTFFDFFQLPLESKWV